MRNLAVVLAVFLTAGCSSHEDALEKRARTILDTQSVDPLAMQLRNVRDAPGVASGMCGEANFKGPQGGYLGFKIFLIDGEKAFFPEPESEKADYRPIRTCGSKNQIEAFAKAHREYIRREDEKHREYMRELERRVRQGKIDLMESRIRLMESQQP